MRALRRGSAAPPTEATISAEALTDRRQIVSGTPFRDRENAHMTDGTAGRAGLVGQGKMGQLERCERAVMELE